MICWVPGLGSTFLPLIVSHKTKPNQAKPNDELSMPVLWMSILIYIQLHKLLFLQYCWLQERTFLTNPGRLLGSVRHIIQITCL